MGLDKSDEPYFVGQESKQCGHYDPNILTIADTINDWGEVLSLMYCFKCDVVSYKKWDDEKVNSFLMERLRKKGWEVHATLDELAIHRERKLRSFIQKAN